LSLFVEFNSQNIKVEFIRHNYKILNSFLEYENIRLYAVQDIAAMKLNAISNRGSKKDFYDVFELLKIYSINELVDFFKEKYDVFNAFTVIKSLNYYEDADLEPDPMMLKKTSWKEVKIKVTMEVNRNF